MEYSVHIETDIIVDAEDEFDAEQKAFDRFVDKGYRGAMSATRLEYEDTINREG